MVGLVVKSQYQGISLKKEFIGMIRDHISDDPRFINVVDFVRFAVLNQIQRDNNSGCQNYQPKGGEESG